MHTLSNHNQKQYTSVHKAAFGDVVILGTLEYSAHTWVIAWITEMPASKRSTCPTKCVMRIPRFLPLPRLPQGDAEDKEGSTLWEKQQRQEYPTSSSSST